VCAMTKPSGEGLGLRGNSVVGISFIIAAGLGLQKSDASSWITCALQRLLAGFPVARKDYPSLQVNLH
jgi:hypothetical protein